MTREGSSDLLVIEHNVQNVALAEDHEFAAEKQTLLNAAKESRLLGGSHTEAADERQGHSSEVISHTMCISTVAHVDDLVGDLSLQLNQQLKQQQVDMPIKDEQQFESDDKNWQPDSWNSIETSEPSGWDQDWRTGIESPENPASGSSSGWGLQPGETEPLPVIDLGYFDQDIAILGSSLVVRVAYTAKGVEDWIQQYSHQDRLFGVDIEWRPNQFKGDDNKAALCQIAGTHGCLIVQLLYIDRIPDALKELLADPNAKLAGVAVKADTKKLFHDYGLECRGEVDLGLLAAEVLNRPDLKRAGLATLCEVVLGVPFKKSKRVCMSNWAVEGLSLPQITYAASDACIAYSLLVCLNAKSKSPKEIFENSSPRAEREDRSGASREFEQPPQLP